jgi:hypothetical protein
MEWSDGASEGTDVKSTGESGTNKFLRTDGDGTSSWQVVDTDLSADTTPQLGGNLDVNTKNIIFGDSADGTTDDVLKFGAGTDLSIYSDGTKGMIETPTGQILEFKGASGNAQWSRNDSFFVTPNLNVTTQVKLNGQAGTSGQVLTSGGSGSTSWTSISAAPEVTLTASEAITAEDAVMVKTNGQAEKITGVNSGVHAENSFSGWSSSNQAVFNICYDPSQNKYLWVGSTGPSNTSTRTLSMRVGTPSSNGETLTWGTLTEMTALGYPESHAEYVKHAVNLVYDDTEDKIFFCYRDDENSGKMRIGWVTISGTTPSIYGQQLLHSWSNINSPSCWYNATNGQVNVAYSWANNSGRIYTNRVYKSGTTPEFSGSTHVTGNNNYSGQCVDGAFGNGVNAIVWKRTSGSNYPVVALSSPGSGTSGAPSMDAWATDLDTVNAGQYGGVSICYHATANKFVAMWHGDGSSTANNEVRARVITCSSSGVTLSGSVQDVATVTSGGFDTLMNVEYDSNAEKVVFTYRRANATKLKTASISGNALVFDDEYEINSGTANMIHSTIDTTKNKTLVMTDLGGSKVFTPPQTNLDANRFVGFAKASVSSGAEVTVKVASNTSTRSETLTPGTTYYIQDTGGVGTTIPNSGTIKAGLAIASNKLLIK